MYTIVKNEEFSMYVFETMHMNVKVIGNGTIKKVYIDYKGYNPAFTMLMGGFECECEMDSIKFGVDKDDENNTMHFIVNSNDLDLFVKEIYCFIVENKVEDKLNEQDIII